MNLLIHQIYHNAPISMQYHNAASTQTNTTDKASQETENRHDRNIAPDSGKGKRYFVLK